MIKNKHKTLGQVYTPQNIVNSILDQVGYFGANILNKKIFEPSTGDGAFLTAIVDRYIKEAKKRNFSIKEIKSGLENNIYGVEIDKSEFDSCIDNLNKFVKKNIDFNTPVKWKIFLGDTLKLYKKWEDKFDFVVGNPPYIRIHNLNPETKKIIKENFRFSDGTIDIYLSFFELGLYCLKADGFLGYITPNSYLHNSSYKKFRNFIKNEKILYSLTDFKSNKMFDGYSTYTAITILSNQPNKKNTFIYSELVKDKIKKISNINFSLLNDNDWSFSSEDDLIFLSKLNRKRVNQVRDYFNVQYGFATLRDPIYISKNVEFDKNLCIFNGVTIEKNLVQKIVKGSTYRGQPDDMQYIIYPYEESFGRFKVIQEDVLKDKYPLTYKYFIFHEESLKKRSMDSGALWYEFGRSQGVQTIHNEKIVVSTLMKDKIIHYELPSDVMVYSGIFITQKDKIIDLKYVIKVLQSKDFKRFIEITGKNFSGGYKSITTTQIKDFNIETLDTSQLKLNI